MIFLSSADGGGAGRIKKQPSYRPNIPSRILPTYRPTYRPEIGDITSHIPTYRPEIGDIPSHMPKRARARRSGTICDDGLAALSLIFIYLGSVLQFLDWVYVVGLLRLCVPGVLSPPPASIPYPPMLQMTVLIYLVPALPLRLTVTDECSYEMHLT